MRVANGPKLRAGIYVANDLIRGRNNARCDVLVRKKNGLPHRQAVKDSRDANSPPWGKGTGEI